MDDEVRALERVALTEEARGVRVAVRVGGDENTHGERCVLDLLIGKKTVTT